MRCGRTCSCAWSSNPCLVLWFDVEHSPLSEAWSTAIIGDITTSSLLDSGMLNLRMTRRTEEAGCMDVEPEKLAGAPPVRTQRPMEISRSSSHLGFVDMAYSSRVDSSCSAWRWWDPVSNLFLMRYHSLLETEFLNWMHSHFYSWIWLATAAPRR